ncbi:MAG: hypothetical protein QG549_398 [Patescibacteria group bacterium]|nr:hypothetical protein [Patescibacteria group bacterium]
MTLQRKNKILEVSIESDALFKADNYIDVKHEASSHSFIFHNVYSPEWVSRALRNVRHVKHVIDTSESSISEMASLYVIKVLYDSEAIAAHDIEKIETFKRMVKTAIESSVGRRPHL